MLRYNEQSKHFWKSFSQNCPISCLRWVEPYQLIPVVEFQECSTHARQDATVMCLYAEVATWDNSYHVHTSWNVSVGTKRIVHVVCNSFLSYELNEYSNTGSLVVYAKQSKNHMPNTNLVGLYHFLLFTRGKRKVQRGTVIEVHAFVTGFKVTIFICGFSWN